MLVSGKSSQVVWVIKMVKLVCKSGSRIPGCTVAALADSEQSRRLQDQMVLKLNSFEKKATSHFRSKRDPVFTFDSILALLSPLLAPLA